jgi:murein L,D-transpeptidase YcbB/YkuD
MSSSRTRRTATATAIAATVTATAAAVLTLGVGGASAGPLSTTAATCPAKEIEKVWYGGTSTVKACENMADRLDHLFYPGRMLTTAQAATYRENVVFVQLRLRDLAYRPLAVDGYYGDQTAGAVTRYQRNHGLVVDGKVGPQTWKELFGLGPA